MPVGWRAWWSAAAGCLRYLITGVLGAFVGGWMFNAAGWKLNLGNEWIDQIVIAAIGAIIVVIIARLLI